MPISRRAALIATGTLLLPRHVRAADVETALFWTVAPPSRKAAILFGYVRIAPAIAPDIVTDGNALIDACQRVVADMPANVTFPTVGLERKQVQPIWQVLFPPTAERLRRLLAATPVAPMIDRVTGLEAVTLLSGEGQHNADVTAAGTIAQHARNAGKPFDQLLSEQDVQSAWRPPDMAAANDRIRDETITYLLDLRDRVGPIGGHLEQLYRERKALEIERLTAEMDRHGALAFSPTHFLESDRMRSLMFERSLAMLAQQADEERFMFFPMGVLTGTNGLLAAFRAKGFAVTPRA